MTNGVLASALVALLLSSALLRGLDGEGDARPRALFVSGDAQGDDSRAPAVAGQILDWNLLSLVSGAGFSATARAPSVPDLLREQATLLDFDVVVLQAGQSDATVPSALIEAAALETLEYARFEAPMATVAIIGLTPSRYPATADLRRVNGVLAAAADANGVPFIDPLELRWTSRSPDLGRALAKQLELLIES